MRRTQLCKRLWKEYVMKNLQIQLPKVITWRRQWHPTPVLLPGESHGRRSLVGCSPWGRRESDTTETIQQQQQQNTCLIRYLQEEKKFFNFLFFGPKLKHLLLNCNSLQLSTISHILQNQLLLNLRAFSKICGFSLLSFLA